MAWLLPAWRNLQQAYTRFAGGTRRPAATTHRYRGGLQLSLTESMPMGKIPSGLVLQLQDLVLEEQPIGAGAEGKVRPTGGPESGQRDGMYLAVL